MGEAISQQFFIALTYIPVDGVGEVPVGGDEEEAAAGDVARQLARLQRLIAVLVAQLVAVGALVLVEHVGRELPALATDPHLDRASCSSSILTSSSHCTLAGDTAVYRCTSW